jgi:hypothetical protein
MPEWGHKPNFKQIRYNGMSMDTVELKIPIDPHCREARPDEGNHGRCDMEAFLHCPGTVNDCQNGTQSCFIETRTKRLIRVGE